MFRFIHSSDLHLGKRFGNFSGDLPSRLREARHAVIARLAQHAREQGAGRSTTSAASSIGRGSIVRMTLSGASALSAVQSCVACSES